MLSISPLVRINANRLASEIMTKKKVISQLPIQTWVSQGLLDTSLERSGLVRVFQKLLDQLSEDIALVLLEQSEYESCLPICERLCQPRRHPDQTFSIKLGSISCRE
jgi:hypothetical protein